MSAGLRDLLAPEQAICDRLLATVSGLKAAKRIADIADAQTTAGNQSPAAFVAYDGMQPGATRAENRVQIVTVRWMVILAVRNARGQQAATGVRDEASPILSAMLAALVGWRPSDEFYEMGALAGGGQTFSSGFGYFWQPFGATTAIEGINP